jgi:hypothetical protein
VVGAKPKLAVGAKHTVVGLVGEEIGGNEMSRETDWAIQKHLNLTIYDKLGGPIVLNIEGLDKPEVVPHYSTDIADCWQIVSQLTGRGFWFCLHYGERQLWEATFSHRGAIGYGESCNVNSAICAAGLKIPKGVL